MGQISSSKNITRELVNVIGLLWRQLTAFLVCLIGFFAAGDVIRWALAASWRQMHPSFFMFYLYASDLLLLSLLLLLLLLLIPLSMFIVLPPWQGHCLSVLSSVNECRQRRVCHGSSPHVSFYQFASLKVTLKTGPNPNHLFIFIS